MAVPFVTLFTGDGTYSWQFKTPETAKMMVEITLIFVLIGGGLLLIRRPLFRWSFTALVFVLFNWAHVVFLPMTVSALYLGYLFLTGYFLRVVLFKQRELRDGWMADFILGTSAVIAAFCLLSAFHAGAVRQLRWFSPAVRCRTSALAGESGGQGRETWHRSGKAWTAMSGG